MGFTPACHIWSSSLISGGHNATHSTYSTKMISLQGFSWIQYSHTQTHSPLCTLEAWQPHKNISMLWGLSWSACLLISHVFSAWRENLESSKSWKAQWLCYTSVFHRDFSCCVKSATSLRGMYAIFRDTAQQKKSNKDNNINHSMFQLIKKSDLYSREHGI